MRKNLTPRREGAKAQRREKKRRKKRKKIRKMCVVRSLCHVAFV